MTLERLDAMTVPLGTSWLLGECMRMRGQQDLWLLKKPDVIGVLRRRAVVESVESSNRIEGVTVEKERLEPIAIGHARPRDRAEEELAGYSRALAWIYSFKKPVVPNAELLLHLHELCQGGASGDAGRFKQRDNTIVEIAPNGERHVRFVPTPATLVPGATTRLCESYARHIEEARVPDLLVIATCVFDLLCIHPFRDGNGRVSRLLTTLLLTSNGYAVPRLIAIERLLEDTKEDYYRVLATCSAGWQEGQNEIAPWWIYFLSTLRQAYTELSQRVDLVNVGAAKSDLVRQTVMAKAQFTTFSLAEITTLLPGISTQLVRKVLADMSREGLVQHTGRGRGSVWQLVVKKPKPTGKTTK